MSSKSVFDNINNDITSDELAEDAYYTAQSTNAVEKWFEESDYSPAKFRNNNVVNAVTSHLAAKYIYNVEKVYEPVDTLMICAASIKSCPLVLEDIEFQTDVMRAKEEFGVELNIPSGQQGKELHSLLIYGHNEDYNDEFNSRLDSKLIDMISRDFKHKYSRVCLFGCFESIDGLKEVINGVYEKLSDKGLFTRVAVYLDSKVRDDDGKWRSLADVINSGYVRPTVVDAANLVEYIMKKFDKKITARLFTKRLKINTAKNLFDNIPEEKPTEKVDDNDNFFDSDDEDENFFDETTDLPF